MADNLNSLPNNITAFSLLCLQIDLMSSLFIWEDQLLFVILILIVLLRRSNLVQIIQYK